MKDNTERAKNLLRQTIGAMPDDFSLTEARAYLKRALSEIEYVESKRSHRIPNNREKNIASIAPIAEQKTAPVAGNWTPQQVMGVINYIDSMIEAEKNKINEIHARKNKAQEDEDVGNEFFRD
jgi:hypothetical protein